VHRWSSMFHCSFVDPTGCCFVFSEAFITNSFVCCPEGLVHLLNK
jgi:hypothetical protein